MSLCDSTAFNSLALVFCSSRTFSRQSQQSKALPSFHKSAHDAAHEAANFSSAFVRLLYRHILMPLLSCAVRTLCLSPSCMPRCACVCCTPDSKSMVSWLERQPCKSAITVVKEVFNSNFLSIPESFTRTWGLRAAVPRSPAMRRGRACRLGARGTERRRGRTPFLLPLLYNI